MPEIWDAYDRDFNKIENVTLVRGEPIPDGMYHLVCDIIVKHVDGTYLLMQRDFNKTFGGMWELTAGGSALIGETPLEGAMRELREETGIVASSLQKLEVIVSASKQSICVEYLCTTDWDKNAITLQKGETVAYKWVEQDELFNMDVEKLAAIRTLNAVKRMKI